SILSRYSFVFLRLVALRVLLSFPTRRSSDLGISTPIFRAASIRFVPGGTSTAWPLIVRLGMRLSGYQGLELGPELFDVRDKGPQDRKSTRLNSSHVSISYAVFCLKKKKITKL